MDSKGAKRMIANYSNLGTFTVINNADHNIHFDNSEELVLMIEANMSETNSDKK